MAVKRADANPTAAERSKLTAFLVAKGFVGTDLATFIRTGRSRGQIRSDLITLFRGLKKG